MRTAVERAASAHVVAKQLFFVGLLSDWLEFFVLFLSGVIFCWAEFSLPFLSMTTIANLTLRLARHDVLSALMLVIQAPCYRQNKWYGSS